jgi:hypothetical protein
MKLIKKPSSHARLARLNRFGLLTALIAIPAIQVGAQIFTVTSPNTLITLQADLSGPSSGLSDWQFAGNSQLSQQWFYYSLGAGPVNSIDQIAAPTSINNHTGAAPFLSDVYANASISVTAKFQLNNSAVLADTLTILNPATASQSQTFHFYQYSHFELGGVAGGQTVVFNSNGAGTQYQVNQTGLAGVSYQGTVSGAPFATVEEQAGLGIQFGLVNGNAAPTLDNVTLTAGPGDAVYAYEWDETLAPGQSFQISELQTVVPEPSSVALITCGMLALLCTRKRFWSIRARQ